METLSLVFVSEVLTQNLSLHTVHVHGPFAAFWTHSLAGTQRARRQAGNITSTMMAVRGLFGFPSVG